MFDVIVIGAGIAGASVAAFLAPAMRTLLLERESQPGYHSTGRSAAVFAPSYGPAPVRALTRASLPFFEQPPAGFCDHPLLSPRGALFVAGPGQEAALDDLYRTLSAESPGVSRLDRTGACQIAPALRPEAVSAAVQDSDVHDIDVNALHQGFLRAFRRAGGELRVDAEWRSAVRDDGHWVCQLPGQTVRARILVNAAGAWGDAVAAAAGVPPTGLEPRRRTAFVFAPAAGEPRPEGPLAIGVEEDWYLKPDAGQWLASPANADPTTAQDVQPEELDLALGIDRIQTVTTLRVGRPHRAWAGLRSFVPDGVPVVGFDPVAPGFFWLIGQGGYGIQTAPALGELAAALVRGEGVPAALAAHGVRSDVLSVARLARGIQPA